MEHNSLIEKNNNNNRGYVGIFQHNLSGGIVKDVRLRLRMLSDQQLFVLKEFYLSNKPICPKEVEKRFNFRIHENTIRKAIHIFFNAGMLSNVPSQDNRFKYYMITEEGASEFDKQLKFRQTPLRHEI